ncbi:translocation/assembly module TamB [Flavobacterium sp.]|uniref:translocation/assembly module TamB domain-containing protein n=1 Tax=Flavobacterium sp. TaxID=239 RepID=UPI0025BB9B4E|nr:translocation/assembly module TamB [Flavobacterium sp.]
MKVFLWIIGSFLTLFLLLVLALQIPAVQNFAKDKAVTYLEGKIKTKVAIDRIEIGIPKKVILEGFYFEDQQKDTLLAGKKLAVDISLFQLLNNKIEINSVDLQDISATISRDENETFNFDYIIKAFVSPPKPEDDSQPMEFSIDKINIDKVKFNYSDATSKNDISVNLNHFDTNIKTFDLNKMEFDIPRAKIDGLKLKFKQGIASANTKKATSNKSSETNLNLKLGKIDLSKIDVVYENEASKLNTKINLEKLNVTFNSIDLNKELIDIETLELNNTKGSLELGKIEKIINQNEVASTPSSSNWKVKIKKADLKKVDFKFDDASSVATNKGVDYKHLDIQNFNLNAENIDYSEQNTSGKINSLTVKDKSGLNIQALKTNFNYNNNGVSLKNLDLKTPQTSLKDEVIVGYASVRSIQENLGEMSVKANLKNSKIGFKDILLFAPTLENTSPFDTNPNAILSVNSIISGKLNNISFPNLEVSGIGSTKINASGKIVGFPDMKKAYFDLNIKNLESSSKDVAQFVPKGTIPSNIQLPSKFNTTGTFKGTMNNFATDLKLVSSFGNAKIKATFDQRRKNQEKYNAQTELDNFDLGKLIKNDSIGKISLKANVKGSGLNPKTANATVDGTILKADFNDYVYTNLKLKGKINNGLFNLNANANDPNLTFNMISNGSFKGKYPSGKLKLNVDIADLRKLNLHAGALKLRGEIDADIQSADLDYLNGKVIANNFIIANEQEQFVLDSINVIATSTAEKNTLVVKSQFMNADVTGKYQLSKIATALQNSISNYYNINSNSKKVSVKDQQFAFKVDVKDNPILLKFIPELKSLSPIALSGRYNSVNDSIIINGNIPKLVYGTNAISGAILKVDTKDNALIYSLVVDDIQNASFQLPFTNITGKVENNIVDYSVQLKDLKNKERYLLVGTLKSENGNSDINLNPTNLILNYEKWNLSEENLIRIGKNGIYANNFELNKDGNSIKIQSQSTQPNAPLAIDFKDFEIETLTNIAQKSNLQIGGKINGNAQLKDLMQTVKFTSDLTIDNFTFQKDTVGNLKVKVDNQIANTYNANVEITGFDNQVNLDGNYKTSTSSFDLNLDIQKLNVKSIQGFSFGNITESTGFLNGDLKITGTTDNPKIIGDLKFNEVGFKVKQLNAKFKSMNDNISFTENLISLDNFVIKDEKNNDLTINGTINSQNLANVGFNLKVDAANFKAINSKAKDNDLYYGELYLDNNLTIKGTMESPVVEGDIKINKDTKFTVVLPQDDPSIADREGIVEFIDQDQPQLITKVAFDEELSQTEIKGILASVNIEIDKEAELSMIIDKSNGDFLKLKGEGQLNGGIDQSGKTTLTGRYELTEGSYEMSFNLIKRKFDIKKGSYLLWTGEPTTADINITAIYKSETAPIDLVNDQLGELTPEERNTYKERIPFETELKLNGELLKPVITFDIVLPDGNNDVSADVITTTQAKLTQLRQQPDELNKQVFALLLLNRFIGENPFSSESGGTTASGLARDSASKILSQQLNNFAGDLISGVEINFDLQSTEDYTTGQKENKTDLNVGISKKLLNDRLKVTVGSSFGLEGTQQANQEANTIAGDVSLDYQITKDGRYKVRAYRVNKYQVALQGQVVETGVAFILTIDYNKFRELFGKNKAEKGKKKKENKKKSDE